MTNWQQAGTIAAGPLMTYALTIGLYFLQRERINPLTYMIGFTASIRAFAGIDGILDLMGGMPIEDATSDEVAVAALLGLSPYVTVGLSLTVLFVMWFLYLRLIARRQGAHARRRAGRHGHSRRSDHSVCRCLASTSRYYAVGTT